MDRRAWWAIVHGVAELDTTEATKHAGVHAKFNDSLHYIPEPAMSEKGSPADGSKVPTLFISMSHICTWPLFQLITERLVGESSISYPELLGSCQIIYFSQSHCYTQNSGHLGYSHGKGNGDPLQYSCLENPKDRGLWWATVHGVEVSDTTQHPHRIQPKNKKEEERRNNHHRV